MRFLPWLLLPLLPATTSVRGVQAGPSQEQHDAHHLEQRQAASGLNLVGEEITILARLLDDEPQTLKVAGISAIGLTGTRDQAAATRFVLQDGTGHLFAGVTGFAELFPSGYGMVVVPTGATSIGAYTLGLVDGVEVQSLLGTVWSPLVCATEADGVLACGIGSITGALRNFGACYFVDEIVVYSNYFSALAFCGGVITGISSFDYTPIRRVGGTTGGGTGTGGEEEEGGPCSVTLVLYVETSTTFVPVGHVGSTSSARASSLSGVGCRPVTSTIEIN